MTFGDVAADTATAVAVLMVVVWLASVLKRDASIVDIFWSLGFVVIAFVAARADGAGPRRVLVLTLITLWGIRLATHLAIRNLPEGEDARYRAMRRRWGRGFPLISLGTVYLFQGVVMWIVSLPVQVALLAPEPTSLGAWDIAGASVWVVGFLFEALGDAELEGFKADRRNAGQVMDRGLWRYTRHPNYFGNAVMWWGLGLISVATPGRLWALVGPALMTVMLVRVSGVSLLERRLRRSRTGYDDYVARTSAFIPRRPRPASPTPR